MPRLGYFDIANPNQIFELPKRKKTSPLFASKGTSYVNEFLKEIKGLGDIGIVTIRGNKVTRRAIRRK